MDIHWLDNLTNAVQQARPEAKMILVDFYLTPG